MGKIADKCIRENFINKPNSDELFPVGPKGKTKMSVLPVSALNNDLRQCR